MKQALRTLGVALLVVNTLVIAFSFKDLSIHIAITRVNSLLSLVLGLLLIYYQKPESK